MTVGSMQVAAIALQLVLNLDMGRFKVGPISAGVGVAGVIAMFGAQNWHVEQVLLVGDLGSHCQYAAFTAVLLGGLAAATTWALSFLCCLGLLAWFRYGIV